MKKTSTRLADGRELIYYDPRDDAVRDAVDRRPLDPTATTSEIRHDPLLGDSVAIASHRQGRTYHPPADECPLCPSAGRPAQRDPGLADYDVVVFENRFPSLAGDSRPLRGRLLHLRPRRLLRRPHRGAGARWSWRPGPTAPSELSHLPARGAGLLLREPRRRDRRHPGPPARPDLRVPLRHPAHRADAALARRAPGGDRRGNLFDDVVERELRRRRGSSWRASTGSPSCRTRRTGRTRCTSTRKRRVPDLLGLDEARAHRVPTGLSGTLEALRPDLRGGRAADAVHRRLAPGAVRQRRQGDRERLRAAPRAFHHPPHFRQAEVPRGFRVRHERVHQRRAAGGRGRATARGSEFK